jgi:hypothetical protein
MNKEFSLLCNYCSKTGGDIGVQGGEIYVNKELLPLGMEKRKIICMFSGPGL